MEEQGFVNPAVIAALRDRSGGTFDLPLGDGPVDRYGVLPGVDNDFPYLLTAGIGVVLVGLVRRRCPHPEAGI